MKDPNFEKLIIYDDFKTRFEAMLGIPGTWYPDYEPVPHYEIACNKDTCCGVCIYNGYHIDFDKFKRNTSKRRVTDFKELIMSKSTAIVKSDITNTHPIMVTENLDDLTIEIDTCVDRFAPIREHIMFTITLRSDNLEAGCVHCGKYISWGNPLYFGVSMNWEWQIRKATNIESAVIYINKCLDGY